jgi:hypothetical protein
MGPLQKTVETIETPQNTTSYGKKIVWNLHLKNMISTYRKDFP